MSYVMKRRARVGLALGGLLLGVRLEAQTHQDFDNPGSPYLLCQHDSGPAAEVRREPLLANDFSGRFLRLATTPNPSHNSVIFDNEDPGPLCRRDVSIAFDFRIIPQVGRADGIGLALLRRSAYGHLKCLIQPPAAEEPNFEQSLGLGFDIYPNDKQDGGNHVTVHYGTEIGEFDAGSLDLASGNWIHASISIRPAGADSLLTVKLKPRGPAEERTLVNQLRLPGFQPYPWRLWMGARSGGLSSHHDIDNIHVVTSGCPALDGRWDPANIPFPQPGDRALPIHAHLLPTGRILFWDRHEPYDPPGDRIPRLWDPVGGSLTTTADPGYDLFCAGHAYGATGRLFVAGGHIVDSDGVKFASTYDPEDGPEGAWHPNADMNAGRWYPTVTTLADGKLLVVSGSFFGNTPGVTTNDLPQVFDPSRNNWRDLDHAHKVQPLYPFMFLAPNGKIFDAGPQPMTRYLDTSGRGAWSFAAFSGYGHRNYGSAAMYRPGQVIILGGSPPDPFPDPPTNSAEVIDLGVDPPHWRPIAPMAFARRQHTATLLPDGKLLVFGGSSVRGFTNSLGAVRHAELWDPGTQEWRTLAPMREPRLYHSTALLLPDGRVFVGGGGHPSDGDNGDGDHFEAEIFSPPYLFASSRPAITSAPASVGYGSTFPVGSADAATVSAVTLVRLGSVTHGFDQNQRFLSLVFTAGPGALNVVAPATPQLAPPGPYMLFILRGGVPSVARIVLIG